MTDILIQLFNIVLLFTKCMTMTVTVTWLNINFLMMLCIIFVLMFDELYGLELRTAMDKRRNRRKSKVVGNEITIWNSIWSNLSNTNENTQTICDHWRADCSLLSDINARYSNVLFLSTFSFATTSPTQILPILCGFYMLRSVFYFDQVDNVSTYWFFVFLFFFSFVLQIVSH